MLCIVKKQRGEKNTEGHFTFAKAFLLPFDLVMVIKKPLLLSICLSGVLFLCSCDKHKLLMAERFQVESEIKRLLDETKSLDDKFLSLKVNASTARVTMERHNAELVRNNAMLEQELASLSKKCAEGEEMVKTLRPQLDSYKAKFVR